jgi:predicted MPP superfamily phosphohydrolase
VIIIEREEKLKELAKKIGELEKEYQVIIISDNGYTKALIVDKVENHGYDYHFEEGRISHSSDCCIEEL